MCHRAYCLDARAEHGGRQPGAGLVTIFKVASATLLPLGGACFRITNASQAEIATVCDNGVGDDAPASGAIVYSTGLAGVYYVEETQPPPGYNATPGKNACDATIDLLCSVYLLNDAKAVGGIAELPDADSAAPLASSDSPGMRRKPARLMTTTAAKRTRTTRTLSAAKKTAPRSRHAAARLESVACATGAAVPRSPAR